MSEIIHKLWRKLRPAPKRKSTPQTRSPAKPDHTVNSDAQYLNREISDIQFIQRIVEEADNHGVPLFERVRLLAISVAVLDQFYTVRVAKLSRLVSRRVLVSSIDGLTPEQQLNAIEVRADSLMKMQETIWQSQKTELQAIGISMTEPADLTNEEAAWLTSYFQIQILPVLTPFTLDEEHPFPYIPSGGMCVILQLVSSLLSRDEWRNIYHLQ